MTAICRVRRLGSTVRRRVPGRAELTGPAPAVEGGHALFPIVLAALCLPLSACYIDLTDSDDVRLREPFSFERSTAGRDELTVVGVNGTIDVRGTTGVETVRAEGYRRVEGCGERRAEELLDELQVRVTETGSRVIIETVQPSSTRSCNLVVDYAIDVPARMAARLIDTNGTVAVRGLRQGVSVTSVNGVAALDDIEGETRVRLTNGPIEAEVAIHGDETIDLLTVNGTISLAVPNTTSATLSATLTNGSIAVAGLSVADLVRTATSLTGTLGDGEGDITLQTTNGTISLTGR